MPSKSVSAKVLEQRKVSHKNKNLSKLMDNISIYSNIRSNSPKINQSSPWIEKKLEIIESSRLKS